MCGLNFAKITQFCCRKCHVSLLDLLTWHKYFLMMYLPYMVIYVEFLAELTATWTDKNCQIVFLDHFKDIASNLVWAKYTEKFPIYCHKNENSTFESHIWRHQFSHSSKLLEAALNVSYDIIWYAWYFFKPAISLNVGDKLLLFKIIYLFELTTYLLNFFVNSFWLFLVF